MIIAAEEHYATEEMGTNLKRWERAMGYDSVLAPEVEWKRNMFIRAPFEQYRLPSMEKNGVSMQIISPQPPAAQAILDPQEELEVAKRYNEQTRKIVEQDSKHFRGFATLPMLSPEKAPEYLRSAVATGCFVGAMVANNLNGRFLDDPSYDSLWTALEELDVPLYIHVWNPDKSQTASYTGIPWLLGPTWNWSVECATHALRLVFGGVFEKHPQAKLILGHLGEGLPFFMRRFDEGAALSGCQNIRMPPSYYLKKNLYITTSGAFSKSAIRCCIDELGKEKIIFACDYPFSSIEQSIECLNDSGLSEEERAAICWENAKRIFRL